MRDLGADAIWISPFFTSPMKDYGYDVADYCDVDPLFGDLADFDRLVSDAHDRELKVMIDWVPNHTSDLHPWFVESRSSRDNPKSDWYWWRDAEPGDTDHTKPPNNWVAAFQRRPGVDVGQDPTAVVPPHTSCPSSPTSTGATPKSSRPCSTPCGSGSTGASTGSASTSSTSSGSRPTCPMVASTTTATSCRSTTDPDTHVHLREIRKVLDSYPGERTTVGEVYLMSTKRVATYYGDHDELHLSFNFPPLWAPWAADAWRRRIERVDRGARSAATRWPTWVLSNHDDRRHRTRYGGRGPRRAAAAVLLLTLRGTPFLYAGEELGLEDAVIPDDRIVDPGGRDGCRAPMPWDATPAHGWSTQDPWLPWPPDADGAHNVEAEAADDASFLALYRRLLAVRRSSPALSVGAFEWLDGTSDGVIGYRRGEEWTVLVNFSDGPRRTDVAGAVELTSDGAPFDGATLAPKQAVLLRG